MITEIQIQSAVRYLREAAEGAAKARAEYSFLNDFSKHLKAKLAKSFAEGSVAGNILSAEASEEYKTHLEAVRIAEEEDWLYRHKLEAAKTIIEVWRSEQATERKVLG